MRLAALGLGAPDLAAVLITHLHSDHITDLNDVITTRWVMSLAADAADDRRPGRHQGRRRPHPGRRSHPTSATASPTTTTSTEPPSVMVIEVDERPDRACRAESRSDARRPITVPSSRASGSASTSTAPRRHRGRHRAVRRARLALCAGADALVHTVIRKDIIANLPIQRIKDTLDYHSRPKKRLETAAARRRRHARADPLRPADPHRRQRRRLARPRRRPLRTARIEIGDDLHRVEIAADHAPSGD